MTTALDLITDASVLAGAIGLAETLSAEEAEFGLRQLNQLMESLSLQPLACYDSKEESITLTAGVASYSTSLLTERPSALSYVTVVGSGVTYPCSLIGDEEYANIGYKSTQGIPDRVNFSISYPHSTLRYFPTPIAGYTSTVGFLARVSGFTSVSTTVELPIGYADAITYNLALRLFAGRDPTAFVVSQARELLANIKRPNTPVLEMASGLPRGRGRFNIYSGANE